MTLRSYFDVAEQGDGRRQKLAEYRCLADAYFDVDAYRDSCAAIAARYRPAGARLDYGPAFDRLLIDTVTSTYPAHEHERFIAHIRGLVALWVRDEAGRLQG